MDRTDVGDPRATRCGRHPVEGKRKLDTTSSGGRVYLDAEWAPRRAKRRKLAERESQQAWMDGDWRRERGPRPEAVLDDALGNRVRWLCTGMSMWKGYLSRQVDGGAWNALLDCMQNERKSVLVSFPCPGELGSWRSKQTHVREPCPQQCGPCHPCPDGDLCRDRGRRVEPPWGFAPLGLAPPRRPRKFEDPRGWDRGEEKKHKSGSRACGRCAPVTVFCAAAGSCEWRLRGARPRLSFHLALPETKPSNVRFALI